MSGMQCSSRAVEYSFSCSTTAAGIDEKIIRSVLSNTQEVKLVARIIGTENQASPVAFEDFYIHLKGKIAKIAPLSITRREEACLWHTCMIGSTCEGTPTTTFFSS